jgi:hypothetical protein
MRRAVLPLLLFGALLGTSGCVTVQNKEYVEIHKAATELESKALGTVTTIDVESSAFDIRRVAAKTNSTLLSESDFGCSITPRTKLALVQQLRAVTAYTKALSSIGSREYQGQFASAVVESKKALDSSVASANELKIFATEDQLKKLRSCASLLASSVAAIGELTIDIYAQQKAAAIVAKTDQPLSAYLDALADVFAPSSDIADISTDQPAEARRGLAGVIVNEAMIRKKVIIKEYSNLGSQPESSTDREKWLARRKELCREFVSEIRASELSVALAISLRDACLALRRAHTALVNGGKTSAMDDLAMAVGRVQFLAQVYNETKAKLED